MISTQAFGEGGGLFQWPLFLTQDSDRNASNQASLCPSQRECSLGHRAITLLSPSIESVVWGFS